MQQRALAPQFSGVDLTVFTAVLGLSVFVLAGVLNVVFGSGSAFEWTTLQDIPYYLRKTDPGFNPHDFYTNNFVEAPRDGFFALIWVMDAIGLGWERGLYVLKVMMTLLRPCLIFMVLAALAWRICKSERAAHLLRPGLLLAALASLLTYSSGDWFSFAAWPPLHTGKTVTPSFVAATGSLALLALLITDPDKGYTSKALLAAGVTFMHPAIGLASLAWCLPLLFILSADIRSGARTMAALAGGVMITVALILVFYGEPQSLTVEAFREIYVRWRHPWHYDPATAYGDRQGVLFLAILAALSMGLAATVRAWRFVIAICASAALIAGILFVHWFATDVVPIRSIIKLGATRFIAFAPLFIHIVCFGAVMTSAARRLGPRSDVERVERIAPAIRAGFAAVVLSSFPLSAVTYKSVETRTDVQAMMDWLKHNTPEDAVIADMNLGEKTAEFDLAMHQSNLGFFIRIFAERPLLADKAYTFTERSTLEFRERLETNQRMAEADFEQIGCAAGSFQVDYALYLKNHAKRPDHLQADYQAGHLFVYRVPTCQLPSGPELGAVRLVD